MPKQRFLSASQDFQVPNKQSSKALRGPGHLQESWAYRHTVWLLLRTPDQKTPRAELKERYRLREQP